MEKITVRISTKEWTQGEYVGFRLKLREGCTATIDWGDGKRQSANARGEYPHYFGKKNACYEIAITSDTDGGIIAFDGDGFCEVYTEEVNVSQCPELEHFGFSGGNDMKCDIDFSHNKCLRHVVLRGIPCKSFDLSANTMLEVVCVEGCRELTKLSLAKNDNLRELYAKFCPRLRRIAVSNHSRIEKADLLFTSLENKSMAYLQKVVDANGGIIISEKDGYTYKSQ